MNISPSYSIFNILYDIYYTKSFFIPPFNNEIMLQKNVQFHVFQRGNTLENRKRNRMTKFLLNDVLQIFTCQSKSTIICFLSTALPEHQKGCRAHAHKGV